MAVKLIHLAHARSGDKGDTANVGLIALKPAYYPILVREVTVARVARHFKGIISANYIDTESVLQKVPTEYLEGATDSFPLFDDPWWGEPSFQHVFYALGRVLACLDIAHGLHPMPHTARKNNRAFALINQRKFFGRKLRLPLLIGNIEAHRQHTACR